MIMPHKQYLNENYYQIFSKHNSYGGCHSKNSRKIEFKNPLKSFVIPSCFCIKNQDAVIGGLDYWKEWTETV